MEEIDWSKLDLEEEMRGLNEEQREKVLGLVEMVKENKKIIKNMEKTIKKLENKEKQEKRRQVEMREKRIRRDR